MKNRKSMGKAQWKRLSNIRNEKAKRTDANAVAKAKDALVGVVV